MDEYGYEAGGAREAEQGKEKGGKKDKELEME